MARPTSTASASSGSGSEATIAEGTLVRGTISGDGALRVHGHVEGDVALRGDLHVAAGGRLRANVDASTILIDGDVEGTVRASAGSVTVSTGARLVGDVQSARFQLDEGGEFAGTLAHDFDLPTELSAGGSSTSPAARRR